MWSSSCSCLSVFFVWFFFCNFWLWGLFRYRGRLLALDSSLLSVRAWNRSKAGEFLINTWLVLLPVKLKQFWNEPSLELPRTLFNTFIDLLLTCLSFLSLAEIRLFEPCRKPLSVITNTGRSGRTSLLLALTSEILLKPSRHTTVLWTWGRTTRTSRYVTALSLFFCSM